MEPYSKSFVPRFSRRVMPKKAHSRMPDRGPHDSRRSVPDAGGTTRRSRRSLEAVSAFALRLARSFCNRGTRCCSKRIVHSRSGLRSALMRCLALMPHCLPPAR